MTTTLPNDPQPTGAREGDCIADRYDLGAQLGKGSFGEVWRAHDRITKKPVALKILFSNMGLAPARCQLEVAALRRPLPGVVELKDDGLHDDHAFFVMELIDGLPFPGKKGRLSWDEIAPVTVALLETLGRVHGAFMVHRDLKPANILVTPLGHVYLLDFGVAYQLSSGSTEPSLDSNYLVGTPDYMAPEQIQSRPVSDSTDLYALGVMLYHALSGRRPHDVDGMKLLHQKVSRRPEPLRSVAPEVPEAVAQLIDRMLAIDPRDRPRTAFDVLSALRGERSVEDPLLPWIGPQTTIAAIVSAVRAGRSVDVIGPRGSGRTRHLLAVEQSLSQHHDVVWLRPEQAASTIEKELRRARNPKPLVLLVDDASRLSAELTEVVARARRGGAVVRALEHPDGQDGLTVQLSMLEEADLRSLFMGPDRLLHKREDAARLLHQRTEGVPARVVRELSTWIDLGIARRVRNLVDVSRDALERLALTPLAGSPANADVSVVRELPPVERDMLVWATLAWPDATPALLSELTDTPIDEVETMAATLVERGLVTRLPGARLVPQVPAPVASWGKERVRKAHQEIARTLAPGLRNRLAHMVAASTSTDGERRALAREAAAQAARLIDEGHLGEAVAAIETGLRAARALDDEAETGTLLGLWVEAAFEDETPHAKDRALYAICRVRPRTVRIERLEHLVRAMLAEDVRGRALAILSDTPPFDDVRLERVRLGVYAAAARKLEDEMMETRLRSEIARSPFVYDDEIAARLDHWRARVLYLRGSYLEAARLHEAAARRSTSVPLRITAMSAGAFSLLEAFLLDEARALAEQARALAAQHRLAAQEAAAEWTLRTIAYRSGRADAPDQELVLAIPHAHGRQFQGAVMSTEAAVAWRTGRKTQALALAKKGYDTLAEINATRGALLLRAFQVALGEVVEDREIDEMIGEARASTVPGIGVQALALLAIGEKLPRGVVDEASARRLAELVPRQHWSVRHDILSMDECLAALAPFLG